MTRGRLTGKTAVITGAGRGIGFAIASVFAGEGARCALLVRRRAAGETAAGKLPAESMPLVVVGDVVSESDMRAAAAAVAKECDEVDILVNNAGVLFDEDRAAGAAAMGAKTLERTLAVNLFGAVHVSEAFLPMLRDGGRIINVSSTMGQLEGGSAGYAPAYCISKTALNAYTEALAADLAPRRIMVDCFHPGWAKTSMGGPGATVDPMQSAQVALFLATRPSSKNTGKFWRHPGVVIDW